MELLIVRKTVKLGDRRGNGLKEAASFVQKLKDVGREKSLLIVSVDDDDSLSFSKMIAKNVGALNLIADERLRDESHLAPECKGVFALVKEHEYRADIVLLVMQNKGAECFPPLYATRYFDREFPRIGGAGSIVNIRDQSLKLL